MRALTIAGATVLALVIWAIADPVLGNDLAVRSGGAVQPVGAVTVLLTAVIAGLAGWALLALLERLTPRAAGTAWRIIAALTLLVSLLGPLGGVGTATKLTLLVLHLTVGLTLIVALPRRGVRPAAPQPAA